MQLISLTLNYHALLEEIRNPLDLWKTLSTHDNSKVDLNRSQSMHKKQTDESRALASQG